MKPNKTIFWSLIFCLFPLAGIFGQAAGIPNDNQTPPVEVAIAQWLTLPGQPLTRPLFHEVSGLKGKPFSDDEFLHADQFRIDGLFPEENGVFAESAGNKLIWKRISANHEGQIPLESIGSQPRVIYLATYIRAERWLTARLEIACGAMMKGWLDGREIGAKTAIDTTGKPGKIQKTLKLERGTHLLLLKVVIPAGTKEPVRLTAKLELPAPYAAADLTNTLSPKTRKHISHMLDGLKVSGITLSHTGTYYLVSYRQSMPPSDQSESWTEIRRIDNRQLIHSYRHARVSQIQWLPRSNRISYVQGQGEKSTLYLHDIEKGSIAVVMKDVEKLGGYRWSPDETFLLFSVREEPDTKEGVMRHVQGMPDRQAGWRNRSFLHRYDIASGATTRLTWGNLSTSLLDISPDSKKILFSQHFPDFTERPYSRQNLFVMDLATFALDTILFNASWGVSATFSPDGKSLLATGGPEAFNGAGLNKPDSLISHNSDIQVYIYDLTRKSVRSITRNFNPSVSSAFWHPQDGQIYMVVTEQDYRKLYRYDVVRELFSEIPLGVDYVTEIDFAASAKAAVFAGNLTTRYSAFYHLDLKSMKISLLENPEAETYKHVEFGQVGNWDFTASTGVRITGRVYYPPGFDPSAKYPVIVYYYGGITPVGRTFAGRYPFNVWAGSGYVVYVLQPSGAIGFGQEFSAAHVNNWGITVADEIIEGTRLFLKAHPWADTTKVGCAGASYGGFMTMLLLTRTNIFTTAISHAGISSISSYWGEGYWGYAYSAGASANSFPWNNQTLYIGQSPLFNADKIHTPLLLITGDEDTNVPPGESIQMYTALKLLGRPVELVMVKGENHHIVTYSKRIQWHNAIMAWWDKTLKGEPEWWQEQFPEGSTP